MKSFVISIWHVIIDLIVYKNFDINNSTIPQGLKVDDFTSTLQNRQRPSAIVKIDVSKLIDCSIWVKFIVFIIIYYLFLHYRGMCQQAVRNVLGEVVL